MTLPTHRLLTIGYRLCAWLRCELAWYRALLHWHLYSDTKCAWCGKITRKAWRQPKTTSHGMCPACAVRWQDSGPI
jgi:hypothetical protein